MGMKARQWRKAFVIASLSVFPVVAAGVAVRGPTSKWAAVGTPVVSAFTMRNLILGSQGYDVYELQNRLSFLGYYKGKVDGKFGWQTYFSVKDFQSRFGLPVTGKVDLKTKQILVKATQGWHYTGPTAAGTTNAPTTANNRAAQNVPASNPASASVAQTVPGITQADINLMAHVVNGEARGEPYKGQVAVAAVILNRMKDPRFPHSIPAIIYSPGAFTCVSDGQVNLAPDASALKAVEAAVHGWDPSHGATYYFNPATATNPWIWSLPEILQIGHHIFCR
jgi:N-acetylmuramoyl-L-alanine amidase